MLHNGESKEKDAKLMVQRKGNSPLPDNKDPREEDDEEKLLNVFNPPRRELENRTAEDLVAPSDPGLDPESEQGAKAPLLYEERTGIVSSPPPQNPAGHPIPSESHPLQGKAISFEAVLDQRN